MLLGKFLLSVFSFESWFNTNHGRVSWSWCLRCNTTGSEWWTIATNLVDDNLVKNVLLIRENGDVDLLAHCSWECNIGISCRKRRQGFWEWWWLIVWPCITPFLWSLWVIRDCFGDLGMCESQPKVWRLFCIRLSSIMLLGTVFLFYFVRLHFTFQPKKMIWIDETI